MYILINQSILYSIWHSNIIFIHNQAWGRLHKCDYDHDYNYDYIPVCQYFCIINFIIRKLVKITVTTNEHKYFD